MAAKKQTGVGSKAGKRDGEREAVAKRPGATKTTSTKSSVGDGGRPRIRSSHSGPSLTGERPKKKTSASGASTRRDPTHAVPRPKRPLSAGSAPTISTSSQAAPRREQRPKKTLDLGSASVASDEGRALATTIAVAALEKKAVGLEILDVAGRVDYADFLVLMTGRSDRQVVALAQGIEDALRKEGKRPLSIEGLPHASWVLMDFGDVVVHVFQDEARSLYDLEGLWMDARRIPVPVPDELLNKS